MGIYPLLPIIEDIYSSLLNSINIQYRIIVLNLNWISYLSIEFVVMHIKRQRQLQLGMYAVGRDGIHKPACY
jgi:hypothetical protein